MEERTIKVSFNDACEWYKNGGILRELALRAFSEEELTTPEISSIIDILRHKDLDNVQRNQLTALHGRPVNKISAPKLLRILAMYYNNGWEKKIGNVGYFLTKKESLYHYCDSNTLGNDWTIVKHESVCYPVTYFKLESDCKKAFLCLKRLKKLDNLYTDF